MGGGASSQAAFEQMLACTMILGEAMVQGLDPRYIRFPDMYRLYDFHVGPKTQRQRSLNEGSFLLFVQSPDDTGIYQQIEYEPSAAHDDVVVVQEEDAEEEPKTGKFIVYVGDDRIVLDSTKLNEPNQDGWTPLHACCHTMNTTQAGCDILEELIKRKENLNRKTSKGPGNFSCEWTPLHITCAYGLEELAIKLIKAGADVNSLNSVHWTPLYEACHRGYNAIVKELLKAGAKVDVICPEHPICPFPAQRPLAEASRQGFVDTVKLLLEWGADKNAVNALGWTALHEAAYHNRQDVVQLLIVYGADVNAKTNKGTLAKDVTISSEIKRMLEDVGGTGKGSSNPATTAVVVENVHDEPKRATASSPKKKPEVSLLARKEDYALLGDLPQLNARALPQISIQEKLTEDEDGEQKDYKPRDEEDAKESSTRRQSSPTSGSKKKTKGKSHRSRAKHGDCPEEFKCAVSLRLMETPMRSPFGHVFEKKVVDAWFRDFGNRCPLTGEPLSLTQLTHDVELHTRIDEWKHGKHHANNPEEKAHQPHGGEPPPAMTTNDNNNRAPTSTKADDPYEF